MRVAHLALTVGFTVLTTTSLGAGTQTADEWRKPGLWSISIANEGESVMRAVNVLQCSAEELEPDILLSILPGQENCNAPEVERDSDSIVIKTLCRVHAVDVFESVLTMRGDFSRDYRGETQYSVRRGFTAANQGPGTHFRARRIGECPVGMKPGDMRLSNGVVVNVIEHKQRAEAESKQR